MPESSIKPSELGKFPDSTRSQFVRLKILLLVLVPLWFLNSQVLASSETKPKHVLVLVSFRPTSPVAGEWSRGIRSVFKSVPPPGIRVDFEYLDIARFNDDQYLKMLLDVYRYKYSRLKPDLIITVNDPSLDFVLEYGVNFFSGTPVVFAGVERNYIERQTLGTNATGFLSRGTYKETLDLALRMHPGTRQVTVVAGSGRAGQAYINAGREVFKEYKDRIEFTYLVGLPMTDILEKVANLSGQTLVIYLPVIVDGAGKKFVAPESLSLISQVSAAPVYSCWEVLLGHGIVGGYLNSFEKMGEAAAELALRILNEENPVAIPQVQKPKFQYLFDWRQLKRWSISEDQLPPGSIVKFKELTVWDMYKGRIIGAFALVLFQALIISYLLYQRRMRRKVEQSYRMVADYTYDWEYWQNSDSSLQYVSPSCERISGYTAQDLMTNPALLRDMIVPEDKAAWHEHRCSTQKEKPSEEIQFRIQRPDGEIRWIGHACQPVFDQQGNYQGVRASNRDITQREFYKFETHQLQTELAHMDRVVTISTLTAALAHEINQPLAAMRSYAQAALRFMDNDHPEYDSVRKALQGIVADNKRAAEVVNRLRDLVKKGPTHRETIEINSVIKDVIGLINSELVLRNASVTLSLHPDVPVVQGDSIQLQQVLINLLTNALDAMEDQPIDARTIVISSRSENSEEIIVSISDSGEGIPADTMEAIFSPFHTTKTTGMGLGLSICRSIMEAHGGKIFAENNPDGGAIFSFILPVDKK